MELLWIIVFIISIAALVKGADWLLIKAERVGLALGVSSFFVGAIIVSLGTSFPELIASFVAASQGLAGFAAANAIGSNLTNILLVVGISAVVGGRLAVTKNLIDLELPLLAGGTALFLVIVWNGTVTVIEGMLMIAVYAVYILYTIIHRDDEDEQKIIPSRIERRHGSVPEQGGEDAQNQRPRIMVSDIIFLLAGAAALAGGSIFLVRSVMELAELFEVGVEVITITAVAMGTSLPELIVSVKAAFQKKAEVALGNIFGSNAFNMMIVVGLPALFFPTTVEERTLGIGLPIMVIATVLFVISGISRRIYGWEGAFFLALYALFLIYLFDF